LEEEKGLNMAKKAAEALVKLIFRGLIPIVFFGGGVALFVTRASPWGVVLGLPAIVIGMVMMIYTYDEVISKKVYPLADELTRCAVCGRLTPRVAGVNPKDTICSPCNADISEEIEKERQERKDRMIFDSEK
jgi:hypothetical protein